MNQKEEAALKRCSERIKKDLDPTYSFLHSLFVTDALTHEEVETVMALSSRESKVTKLLTILPRRGPNAYTLFRNLLKNDYDWLANAMDTALQAQTKKLNEEEIHKNLVRVINRQLVPLIFSGNFNYADHRDPISHNITKVGYLTTTLEHKVYKALSLPENPQKKVSIEKLIEEKLKEDKSVDAMSEEIQVLKKRLKLEEKLKREMETVRNTIEHQKKKIKEHQKMMKQMKNENKLLKQRNEKLLKEKIVLEMENKHMKTQLGCMNSGCEIKEMF